MEMASLDVLSFLYLKGHAVVCVTWGVVAADQGGALIVVSAHMQGPGERGGDGWRRGHRDVARLRDV